MIVCKIALNALVYGNVEDEGMSSMSKPSKNKDISPNSGLTTFTSNHIFINKNNLDLDVEQHAYKITLIVFNHN